MSAKSLSITCCGDCNKTGEDESINHDNCHNSHCCSHEHHHAAQEPVDMSKFKQASDTVSIYRIMNMDCPMEEALIRKKLDTLPSVKSMEFNLMQRVLTVEHVPGTQSAIEAALTAIDMIPEPIEQGEERNSAIPETHIPWKKLAWATVFAILSEAVELCGDWSISPFGLDILQARLGDYSLAEVLALVFAIISIAMAGLGTFKKGWLAVTNFNLNMNALMAVAVTGAVLIGQFPEAAMVMVLFNISEAIEAKALDKARNAIKDLMSLAPETVAILQADGSWRETGIKSARPGDIARARPGQKIALDGEVISGNSTVNQAPITGESIPVEKKKGDTVYAGTINEAGSLEYRVTAAAHDTTLARIIHAVEEAQNSRAPIQRFVDTFAKYYTPAVFIFAILWALVPPLFFGASWNNSIYTALVILVIGCPCALVISTPVTVVSGMAAATRKGILIKGGLYLEQGRRLNWLALDKTGTITSGQPRLTDFEAVGDFPTADAKIIAASLAGRSDHPVSKAIAEALGKTMEKEPDVNDFEAIPGKGVSGIINGEKWSLGNHSLIEALGKCTPFIEESLLNLEKQGKTVVALIGDKGVAGLFAVADTVKPSSVEAIRALKKLSVQTLMLTGDNEYTARAIAGQVDVDEFRANLLPDEKLKIIEKLENSGNVVGMAGDGINDSPALARANIGFAMAGCGTDTAIETADVAIMDDDLRKIPRFIRLSRATYTILLENIALALGIKAVFFALTLTGNATMWMAVFADVGAALLVILNGLRAMRK